MEIIIQPIIAFLKEQELFDKNEKTAAIFCTSYGIQNHVRNDLNYCHLEFHDTEIAGKTGAFSPLLAEKTRLFVDSLDGGIVKSLNMW